MKYSTNLKSFVQIVLAGICAGLFFAIRSFSVIRLSSDVEAEPLLLWTFASLSTIGMYAGIATVLLAGFWLLYSGLYARVYGVSFNRVLALDASSYLPLCALAMSLLQFNTLLTHYSEAFLLLGQDLRYVVLLCTLIGVYHLKKNHHRQLQRIVEPNTHTFGCVSPHLTWQKIVTIFLISLGIYVLVGLRITHKLPLGGDEPHYLLITHSLIHDHDLKIRNNYQQKDYQAFYPGDLTPHLSIGKDATRYSIHPIGLSFLLIPGYALYGRQGAVWMMNIFAALLALQLYLLARAMTNHQRLSLIIWVITSFTTPILVYSSQLYPEIPSALLLGAAYYLIRFHRLARVSSALLLGGILAFLPWLQQRMILPTCLLALYYIFLAGIGPGQKGWKQRLTAVRMVPLLFLAVSGILMAAYYYHLYGNPLPNAPYLSVGRHQVFSSAIFIREGVLGLLFDQDAGLFIFSPYYIFALSGYLVFLRRSWRHALVLLALILSIYVPCAGFVLQWRGAWSPAARYLVAQIPLFVVPFCIILPHLQRSVFRYTLFLLVAFSFFWSYLFLQIPPISIMSRNGINAFFEQYSRLIDLTKYFPSFTPNATNTYVLAGLWLTAILIFSLWVYKTACATPHSVLYRSHQAVQEVFLGLGVLFVFILLLSHAAQPTQNPALSYISRNRQIQKFLQRIDNPVLTVQGVQPQSLLSDEQLGLKYMQAPRRATVDQAGPRFLITGPQEPFTRGRYTAYFTMNVEPCPPDQRVVTLDVVANKGRQVFLYQNLYGKDFASPGQDVQIPLTFDLPEDVLDLETRVYFHNNVNLTLQKIMIVPHLDDVYYRAGLAAVHAGQQEKARQFFSQAGMARDHLLSWYLLGILEQDAGNWEYSAEILQRVVSRDPSLADAHYRLGLALQQRGDFSEAQHAFAQAVAILPGHLDAWQAQLVSSAMRPSPDIQSLQAAIQQIYQPEHPYAVNFGNQILFLGYTIRNPKPGTLQLDYYWKALFPMTADYIFFVHASNPSDNFQQDHAPHRYDPSTGQGRLYPTSSWRVGELVHERFELSVPAGAFTLRLGIWDPHGTKKRLPIIGSTGQYFMKKRNELVLEPIEIH